MSNNTFLKQCGGFTPVPDEIVAYDDLGYTAAFVWGMIWRWCQQDKKNKQAELNHAQIAARCGISARSVATYLKKLIKAGFLEDLTPNVRNKGHVFSIAKGEEKIIGLQNLQTSEEETEQEQADGTQVLQEGEQELQTYNEGYAEIAERGLQNLQLKDSGSDKDISSNHQQRAREEKIPEVTKDQIDQEFGDCVREVETTGIPIKGKKIGDLIADCYKEISPPAGESRLDWFKYASVETAANARGHPNWRYFEKVLENIQRSGSLATHRAEYQNGATSNGHQSGNRKSKVAGEAGSAGYHSSLTSEYLAENREQSNKLLNDLEAA